MYKPLVISRSYLLDKSSTGQIQRVFWEYANKHGIRPTILCSKSIHNDVPVDSIKCQIIQTFDSQLIRYFIAFLKRMVAEEIAYLPDYSLYSWAKISAINKAKKEACSGKYDFIHSVCTPFSGHLIALEAKKASDLPWIASFYDPWYDNPYRPIKSKKLKDRDRRFEAEVAKNADVILHTNNAILEEWVDRYGEWIRKKMFVQPLVFNADTELKIDNHEVNSSFVISHIGSLYPNRDSVDFLKALRLLLLSYPEIKNVIRLNYVGTVTENDRHYVNEYGFDSFTKFVGFLNEKDCIPYFLQTNLFLAVDGKDARNIFFPSKILKYFYYGKPILGLTPSGSALQYELEKSHNYCFRNEDYQGIADFMYQAIMNEEFLERINTSYWKKYTMDCIFPQYLDVIERVLGKK